MFCWRVGVHEAQFGMGRGFWDGGFDDELPEEVGLGWHLQFCKDKPHSQSTWRPLLEASAKTKGFSSACAELAAFTNMIAMTSRLLQNLEVEGWQTIPIEAP